MLRTRGAGLDASDLDIGSTLMVGAIEVGGDRLALVGVDVHQ
ncbi:hypothetical protein Tco_0631977, partial [Tanacetum coccineum]